ncbi:hypothetical protein WA026_004132 [Henosepilachna vigintioctopunctata]|uniref:Uncharacterized protein n=1 Tax=Henosepilachna vigintioctopunctata TaxID=420089 RepID=A0AAW1U6D8_9CUCU
MYHLAFLKFDTAYSSLALRCRCRDRATREDSSSASDDQIRKGTNRINSPPSKRTTRGKNVPLPHSNGRTAAPLDRFGADTAAYHSRLAPSANGEHRGPLKPFTTHRKDEW